VRFEQLGWLGLSSRSLQALAPHATWLPERTTLNINTASDMALYASVSGLDLNQARKIVQQRSRQHFKSLKEVSDLVPSLAGQWSDTQHGTSSRYFLVRGRLTLDGLTTQETSLVVRHGQQVSTLWRQRGGLAGPELAPSGPPA
jgi:general secretion pathway protein K